MHRGRLAWLMTVGLSSVSAGFWWLLAGGFGRLLAVGSHRAGGRRFQPVVDGRLWHTVSRDQRYRSRHEGLVAMTLYHRRRQGDVRLLTADGDIRHQGRRLPASPPDRSEAAGATIGRATSLLGRLLPQSPAP